MGRPPVEPRTPLAARLRRVREAISGEDRDLFARIAGIASSTIGNYERGDRVPDAEMIGRYWQASRVSLDWLITGEGEMFDSVGAGIIRRTGADLAGPPVEKVSALETLRVLAPRHAETGPDHVRLAAAIEAVEEGLAGRNVAPAVKAELTIAAYHLLAAATDENRAQVIRLVKGA